MELPLNKILFKERRKKLVQQISTHLEMPVLLLGAFENERSSFYQDSSFFYFTGISEPGLACIIEPDESDILLIPDYASSRAAWMGDTLSLNENTAQIYGFEQAMPLGKAIKGYRTGFFDPINQWDTLIIHIKNLLKDYKTIGICPHPFLYRLYSELPALKESIYDISPTIASMRRSKSKPEIELLFRAGEVTLLAQEAAAAAIKAGESESSIRASIDYIFAQENAEHAFPSIVAGGKRATILHYTGSSESPLSNEELVIIDIGASVEHYCADVTRTYPVSGTFSKRQLELYRLVLEAQELVANLAQPGFYLRNNEFPEKSLHHHAVAFFKDHNLDAYFTHGIGHFLGLDVHDTGDVLQPLQEGDVITIEPGLYIPQEGIGIRIEDDYWIVKNGAVSLTDRLPKAPEALEDFIRQLRSPIA
ncbi:TPA: hypothetical protein DDZ86_02430 [Candidatus Dependentiae bacterium]|nr:MAG: Xaa-Pro aminopeptidase [candidate division TM6 bacterium GW2011_GWF2_43_87]HBL98476.1 hypothetical protein [Candidatus Dependentiae bacterium]